MPGLLLIETLLRFLEQQDRSYRTLEEAFEKLGESLEGSQRDLTAGINAGLIERDSTFLFLAADFRQ